MLQRELTAQIVEQGDGVAARLAGELRRVLSLLPDDARKPSALSRLLGIEKTTCFRITSVASSNFPEDLRLLVRVPGVRGLRKFVSAVRGGGYGDVELDSLESAIDQFESLLRETGGSQAALARALRAEPSCVGPDPNSNRRRVRLRHQMHDLAARLAMVDVAVTTFVVFTEPAPDDAEALNTIMARGWIGVQMLSGARPFTATWAVVAHDESKERPLKPRSFEGDLLIGRSTHALLSDFCSDPLPRITVQELEDPRFVVGMMDPCQVPAGTAFDIVTGNRHRHPRPHPGPPSATTKWTWVYVTYPTRRLIVDLYVHRELARTTRRPVAECHAHVVGFNELASARWLTQLPERPGLIVLPATIDELECAPYPRQTELTAYILETNRLQFGDFDGYRMDVRYPLWGAMYGIALRLDLPSSPPGR